MSEAAMHSGGVAGEMAYCGTVDGVFCDGAAYSGVSVGDLPRGAVVRVETRHSRYRFQVLDGAQRLAAVHGGCCLGDETVARIDGSRLGESMLKVGWIGVGFRIELSVGGRVIVTSPVRSITIEEVTE
jgi:hypothetical protein